MQLIRITGIGGWPAVVERTCAQAGIAFARTEAAIWVITDAARLAVIAEIAASANEVAQTLYQRDALTLEVMQ